MEMMSLHLSTRSAASKPCVTERRRGRIGRSSNQLTQTKCDGSLLPETLPLIVVSDRIYMGMCIFTSTLIGKDARAKVATAKLLSYVEVTEKARATAP
ncbi:MAG TPA: hypothetical protein DC054_00135 [Blastocatellia bacterium]|nr:hypothetical protein [Blastocatellia bacterium]